MIDFVVAAYHWCLGPSLTHSIVAKFVAIALASTLPLSALACEGLRDGPKAVVIEVTDGDTVVLDTDIKVRLIGMQAPKLPLGRDGFETWPLADTAKAALEELALGQTVQLRFAGEQRDRHGRALAHMFIAGETEVWAQQAMLEAGLARVYSFSDNRFCLDMLYAAERSARAATRGIWTDPFYALRQADAPEELLALTGNYELVEGRVLKADRSGSRIYLNFGRYWKEDFTVVLDRDAQKIFEQAGIDPLKLEDALVRVRGWIDDHDGPRMNVTHPEQIEVLATR